MEEFTSEQTPTAEAAAFNSTVNPVGIDGYFGISERGSTIPIEILAGLSTFLALSYIFVVNPAILAQVGIPTAV
jgi:adenine/guanine/hypoxanthine permease